MPAWQASGRCMFVSTRGTRKRKLVGHTVHPSNCQCDEHDAGYIYMGSPPFSAPPRCLVPWWHGSLKQSRVVSAVTQCVVAILRDQKTKSTDCNSNTSQLSTQSTRQASQVDLAYAAPGDAVQPKHTLTAPILLHKHDHLPALGSCCTTTGVPSNKTRCAQPSPSA
jgi:hypothetical protein